LRHPVLQHRLPGQQHDPRLERPGLPRQLPQRRRQPALDEQLPGIHGPHLPAPCESACTLGINDEPVGIKSIERKIADAGWEHGWIVPQPAAVKTGKKVAVVGSGPAGLSAAQQLARAGHDVTVFEKSDRIGGLLRYGIPDFKMEKGLIDRRVEQMQAEGVTFRTSTLIGKDFPAAVSNMARDTIFPEDLVKDYDAVVMAGGAERRATCRCRAAT
jgi:glutamate synthase (NADPH/NADH) small chain